MKMKKLALIFVLGFIAVFFVACGNDGENDPSAYQTGENGGEVTTDSNGTASIEVTDIVIWTQSRHDLEFMQSLVDEINADYDDINVILEVYTDNFPQIVEIAASTDSLPDILTLLGAVPGILLPRDALYPLDDLMPDGFLERFDSELFVEGTNMNNGYIVSLPNTGNADRLVYNRDIFDRLGLSGPPQTLEQLVEYSRIITTELSNEGIFGFALPFQNPTNAFGRGATAIPQLSGYPVHNGFNFQTGEFDFGVYAPVMEALQEIFTGGYAFPGSESLLIDPIRTQFAEGNLGMYMVANHSEWGVFTEQFPTDVNWAYANLPTITGEVTGSVPLRAGAWWGITRDSEDPEKAWRVLERFYAHENLVAYFEGGFGLAVNSTVIAAADDPESVQFSPMMAIQNTDQIWPHTPHNLTIQGDTWADMFVEFVFGVRNDLDDIIEELNERYNDALREGIEHGTTETIQFSNFDPANPANSQ